MVIEMPSNCETCPYFYAGINNWCAAMRKKVYCYGTTDKFCPLRSIPEKLDDMGRWTLDGYIDDRYSEGYNDCIDEILAMERQDIQAREEVTPCENWQSFPIE